MQNIAQGIKRLFRDSPISTGLLFVNIVLFVLTLATGGFNVVNLARLGALVPEYVTSEGEYFRILTSMFLHGNIFHFAMNMLALYILGTLMERLLGPINYFILYILSGLAGGVAITLLAGQGEGVFAQVFGTTMDVTIGASGSLYGIMAALFFITFKKKVWFNPRSIRSIRTLVIINFALTFTFPGISILGHIGGFVIGMILSFFLVPDIPYFRKQQYRRFYEQDMPDDEPPLS
ncbi:MAG: rhomboid family intramembrane serine protease [Candidatus Izemoplasmatales bacterium]|jgi:rhomboid protease GluP